MNEAIHPEGAILNAALELPADARAAYLDNACAGDMALRQRVEALLQAHEQAQGFLEAPLAHVERNRAATAALGPAEEAGDCIGPYKLLQQIGEGGCGVVYMAEQKTPIQRRVALKVIKPGMDTKQVIARFEAERQALALMDHPNIAKVLDAGATDSGRPYFVMELVRGTKITDFCDEQSSPTEERLRLFIQVCQAIQHAHQKGVIHRDVKPSNILVTINDGVPVPKVIDFGIAKATQGRLTDQTVFTAFEQFLGTPAYMSPEQAVRTSLDVDTRSDIYSLGVLLYELLTGSTPFDQKELLAAGMDEMRRTIRENEPPRPSTRLSTMEAEALTTTAKRRRTDSPKLIHLVRGDLDWIVMKCLEKDRSRRYQTANGLATDIQRHLNCEPVVARPPTAGYRFQKFIRKHQLTVGVAAGFVLVLAVATAVSTALAIRAGRQKARAEQAEKTARKEAEETKAVLGFLRDKVLAAARPEGKEGGLGRQVTVRQAVEAAESQIAVTFTNQPLVEAEIRNALGQTFLFLGDYAKAIQQQQQVLALANANLEPNDAVRLDYLNNLAVAYRSDERLDAALPLLEEALQRRKASLGPDHPSTVEAMNNLGVCHWRAGRVQEALALFQEALQKYKARLGPDHPDSLKCMQNLAAAYQSAGRPQEAIPLYEEAMQKTKAKLGPSHPDTLLYMDNLAQAYQAMGRIQEAVTLLEEVLQKKKGSLGPDHPDTLQTMINLSLAYHADGRMPEALPLVEEVAQRTKAKLGPDDPATLRAIANLAAAYSHAGRPAESELLFRQVLSSQRKSGGTNTTDLLSLAGTLQKFGICLLRLKKPADAEPILHESLDIRQVLSSQSKSGRTNVEELLPLASVLDSLADCLVAQRKHAEAEPLLRESLAIYEGATSGKWQEFLSCSRLGDVLFEQEKYAEAEPLLVRAYQGMEQGARTAGELKKLKLVGERLVQLYVAWGRPDAAEEWRKKLPEAKGSPSPPTRP